MPKFLEKIVARQRVKRFPEKSFLVQRLHTVWGGRKCKRLRLHANVAVQDLSLLRILRGVIG
jgi:hypothetical protein